MGGEGVPARPLLVGGSGLVGSNLLVLLANVPGVERIRVVDLRPPSQAVLSDAGIAPDRLEFIQHRLGSDSQEALQKAVEGCDCVFWTVTPHVQLGTAEDFQRTNVDGLRVLLEASISVGVPRLIFLSSIAVSNHLVESIEWDEEVPLPPLETYQSSYDLTKRKGEELVLAANGKNGLRTCALRPGGVLLSPNDFTFRNLIVIPGIMFVPMDCKKVDMIDGRDVCCGMLLGAKALVTKKEEAAGKPFWLSKGEGIAGEYMAKVCAECLGWTIVPIPLFVVRLTICFYWLQFLGKKALGLQVPGFPPHLFMRVCLVEQTFDTGKARRVLGYESKVTIKESCERICKLYLQENPDPTAALWRGLGAAAALLVAAAGLILALR